MEEGFIKLAQGVGIPTAILAVLMWLAWLYLKMVDARQATRDEASRQERQQEREINQQNLAKLTDAHVSAMKGMSDSVVQLTATVAANTEQMRNCQKR